MNLCKEQSKLYYDFRYPFHNIPKLLTRLIRYRHPWTKFHRQIFSGYTVRFPKGPVSQFNTHAQNVLEFLFWLTKHDIEIPNPLEYYSRRYESETKPWHGFKIILNALQSYEDFGIGMLSKFRFKDCRNDVWEYKSLRIFFTSRIFLSSLAHATILTFQNIMSLTCSVSFTSIICSLTRIFADLR